MYSSEKDSMTILLSVYMWHKKTKMTALLDSGATHNFINKCAITSLGLGTCPLPHSKSITLMAPSIVKEALLNTPSFLLYHHHLLVLALVLDLLTEILLGILVVDLGTMPP
jgi:hypothetical protein